MVMVLVTKYHTLAASPQLYTTPNKMIANQQEHTPSPCIETPGLGAVRDGERRWSTRSALGQPGATRGRFPFDPLAFRTSTTCQCFRVVLDGVYKGSAPRAADAAPYARARNDTTKCEGARIKRPMIWCIQRFDDAKS